MNVFLFLMRWGHFLAGITWIGLLYFFNAVSSKFLSMTNSNFMGSLDAQTKLKIYPNLMPKALWWFRWGALWTVIFGIIMYGIYFPQHMTGEGTMLAFKVELAILAVIYVLNFWSLGLTAADKNKFLQNLMALFVLGIWVFALVAPSQLQADSWITIITPGGGFGILMLLNVWGIIWRNQKKIIQSYADQAEGKPALPELAKLAKVAAVASRINFWLSIPMLFCMAGASHLILP